MIVGLVLMATALRLLTDLLVVWLWEIGSFIPAIGESQDNDEG